MSERTDIERLDLMPLRSELLISSSEWVDMLPSIHRLQHCDALDKLKLVTIRELENLLGIGHYTWCETDVNLNILSYRVLHQADYSFLGASSQHAAERLAVSIASRFFKNLDKRDPVFLRECGVSKRLSDSRKTAKRFVQFETMLSHLGIGVMAFCKLNTGPTGRNVFVFSARGRKDYTDKELASMSVFLSFSASQFNLLHKVSSKMSSLIKFVVSTLNFRILDLNASAITFLKELEQTTPGAELEIPKALKKDLLLGDCFREEKLHKVKINHSLYLYRVSHCVFRKALTIVIYSSEWINKLTVRQLDVVLLLKQNLSKAEIAAKLHLSERTIDGHCEQIYQRLGVNSRFEVMNMCQLGSSSQP